MMNDQLFEMLRDRLESIDDRLGTIQETIKDHVKKDEVYWQKIDRQEGQISLLKLIFGSSAFVGVLACAWTWLSSKIGG